ncbi:hypothetical protein HK105_206449 [Polyrhizophydium stewartii]|uniref:Uncharacterized protein n=1 Tax=Polyrhizophydium stewartii TaxID=2732419 RepID=A0ABR4N386_9FUNG
MSQPRKVPFWRSFLTYESVRSVRIQDPRLGGLYYLFFLAIWAYILYNMFTQGTYLQKVPPVGGSVRATTLLPASTTPPPYCTPNTFNPNGCVFWTQDQIVFPFSGELNTVFITTRVTFSTTVTPASRGCTNFSSAATTPACAPPSISDPTNVATSTFFVANVEDLSLRVDHAIRGEFPQTLSQSKFLTQTTSDMKGKMLRGCDGNPNDVGKEFSKQELDTFTLGELLAFATCSGPAVSLDNAAFFSGVKPKEPWRSSGMVISVPIKYNNRETITNAGEIKYAYVPAIVNNTEFKIVQQFTNADGSITYVNRHGVRIVFEQTGTIGQFDFVSLVLNLVTALALLSVATVIVEYLMLYALKDRKLYESLKYGQTVDLSDKAAVNRYIESNPLL